MMLYQLTTDGDMEILHIDNVAPWFERSLARGPQFLEGLRSPRIFKTHLSIDRLPTTSRCIYIVRNPKDTCISYYHHLTSLSNLDLSLPQFVAAFLEGKLAWGSWFEHLHRSMRMLNPDRVLFLNYDDLINDLPGVVDRVARFCGIYLDARKRDDVISRCSFDFMKRYNLKFDPRFASARRDRTEFIRKGRCGDWINELSPQLAATIDEALFKTVPSIGFSEGGNEFSFLQSGTSNIRGTVQLQLQGVDGVVLLQKHSDNHSSSGMFLPDVSFTASEYHGLAVGDSVRLKLGIGNRTCIIEEAKVLQLQRQGRPGVYFGFLRVERDQIETLELESQALSIVYESGVELVECGA